MPDVSPPTLIAARRGFQRIYGRNPDAVVGECGICTKKIDEEQEKYVISVDGVWTHFDCINDQTKERS